MKPIIHKIASLSRALFALFAAAVVLQSCEEDKAEKWVDLRYRVQDAYTVAADGSEEVTFKVKSTDPWEVFGENKYEWYSISPSAGEAGDTYDVTIKCKPNPDLDDRTDIITIKSDYWVGKKVTFTQKGIAFLNYENLDLIDKEGNPETFDILSNQNWTASITSETSWLTISSGASGTGNGQITLTATPNTGAMRYATLTIYDRHGVKAQEIRCTQDGVLLDPAEPQNKLWYAMTDEAQELIVHIEANSKWRVSKENEINETWYHFEKTEFDGSAELVIKVDKHDAGSNVRTGIVILTSVAEEGATPVEARIKIKQASSDASRTKVTEMNRDVTGDWNTLATKMGFGRYSLYVGPFGDASPKIFFIYDGTPVYTQLNYYVVAKKTQLSTTPWSAAVYTENSAHDVDTSVDNKFTLEVLATENETGKWLECKWYLNDVFLASTIADGSATWKIPYADVANAGTEFMLRCQDGSIPCRKWEYTSPIAWGD